jgi:heme oxygenase (biliverdin-producing, ferredoxin)
MGGMARKSMRLEGDQGTAFYQFDGIQATKPFIEEWYAELNRLELSDAQKQAIVDEGNLVFALNIEVFEELEGNPVQALWTLATASLRSALGLKD